MQQGSYLEEKDDLVSNGLDLVPQFVGQVVYDGRL